MFSKIIKTSVVGVLAAIVLTVPVSAQQITRDNSSGFVTGLGSNLTPQAGETTCTMSSSLASQVSQNQPNGGLVVTSFSPTPCTGTVVATPAPPTPTATPTTNVLVAGSGAGTGATVSFVAGANSNLSRGAIQWTTGTSPSSGSQVVITFTNKFSEPPFINCTPMTAATALLNLYMTNQSASGVTIAAASTPTASVTYSCEYALVP